MNGEFLGKTAIITGGASGMGLLTGKRMYEDGANVVLVDCDGSSRPGNRARRFTRQCL